MASEARRIMGSIDAAQASTGHKSLRMIEHYAMLPTNLQKDTVLQVGLELEEAYFTPLDSNELIFSIISRKFHSSHLIKII